ncbi:hypothetical protein IFM89_031943 [Coptis chinensis]|uniref:Pentatricopeptide repeat-containing protein n=1 Tax=Coptis chinensis TaxID=261450 RepID=A0A835MCZ7_9MAGN|nr:hypothetical protein IFM89_031943 [Coptis chinensis]
MLRQGFRPCPVTMVSAIPSCAQMELFFQGKSIHGFGIKVGLDLDSRVENALTSMYAKCSDLDAARLLFEGMPEKCVVSWNTMISAYGQNGYFDEAILVFKQMREEDLRANSVTIVSLLSVNAHLESAHSYAVKIGLDSDASVITSLVCMYARSGNTTLAQSLYEWMPCKNLVSITAIISSYAEKGNMDSVLKWFYKIQHEDMKPDAVTIVSILHGFTNLSYLRVGISLHGYSIKCGLTSYSLVINGLISMYDKFDDMDAAASLFLSLDERPLFSWNSMISVYVQRGMLDDATDLFCQMKMFGCSPDTITMTSMLSGCSQLGSLKFGRILHNFILRNSLETEDFMGTALIDMYAKCGSIENAERVFKSIKEPCLATWNAMILGYGMSRLEHKSLSHFSEMMKWGIKPDDITFLGVLSACGHSGLVDDAQKYFKMMEEFGVVPGVQHCTSMVDLLSRAGLLDEALTFIKGMKVEPDSVTWLALLGACYLHQEVKLGESLAKKIFLLDQRNGGLYVLMSNLYASTGRWNDVVRVRKMMREDGEDGCSGTSIIEK